MCTKSIQPFGLPTFSIISNYIIQKVLIENRCSNVFFQEKLKKIESLVIFNFSVISFEEQDRVMSVLPKNFLDYAKSLKVSIQSVQLFRIVL